MKYVYDKVRFFPFNLHYEAVVKWMPLLIHFEKNLYNILLTNVLSVDKNFI